MAGTPSGSWPLQGKQAGQGEQATQGDQPLVGGQAVHGELAGYHILKKIHLLFQPNFPAAPLNLPDAYYLPIFSKFVSVKECYN